MTNRQKLLELLREKSVKTGSFTLASGKRSDFYVDVRQTSLHSEGSWLIADALMGAIPDHVEGIGGLTMGADPWPVRPLQSLTAPADHCTPS